MSHVKHLQVPCHQQDTGYYCGAACAQMVLDSIGAGLLDQDDLYNDNHTHTNWDQNLYNAFGQKIEWATPPDGLTWTLNNHRPAGTNGFAEYPLDLYPCINGEDSVSHKIAWTIEHYGVAPCALVMGAAHWIVVTGMDLSQVPANVDDTSYAINKFWIIDPWPPVPSSSFWANPAAPPPPPHSTGDGCGSAGVQGAVETEVSYAYWQSDYMTGADYHSQGHWQGLFVAVCDPDPPAIRRAPQAPPVRRFDGRRLITANQAAGLATELLSVRRQEDDRWRTRLKAVTPVKPVLVKRLDRLDDYYYLVPLASGKRGAVAAMTFDARFGTYQQATFFQQPEPRIVNLPSNRMVLDRVVGRTFELEGYAGQLRVRQEIAVALDEWFWRPCKESLSPLWPFKMIAVGSQWLYYRIDGAIFTQLHTNVLGI